MTEDPSAEAMEIAETWTSTLGIIWTKQCAKDIDAAVRRAVEEERERWIKTSERLPESDCQVLVSGPHNIELVTFNKFHGCWDGADGDDYYAELDYFKWWMPLPEEPKVALNSKEATDG